jgi:DMSO/TMAO reductase YedYZ molybdopterin-dependent catalytic subunit
MVPRLRLPRRAGRRTNLGLLTLLVLAGATGLLAYAVGTPGPARVVVAVHGAAGLGLLLLVPWKAVVVRRAWRLPRSARAPAAAVLLAALVVLTVASGVLHAVGLTGPWAGVSALQVHVGAAVCALVVLVEHAWGRRQRFRATDLRRRALLQAGGLGLGAAALWGGLEGALRLTGAPGARRRATGSAERGSGDPEVMPVTQWFTDEVPTGATDTVTVAAGGRTLRVPVADLGRGDRVRAVLDCTGGWYAEQEWAGVRLDRLLASAGLDLPDGGSVDVVSATGYTRRLPLSDAPHLLLATAAAGTALSAGHGAPVRLVAPGRRGFWWVKWVVRVEVVDAPWWVQSPFPLQ